MSCPICGSSSVISRITIVPPTSAISAITNAKASRAKPHRRRAGREPPHSTTPARSTA
jgi:hypothetical protein